MTTPQSTIETTAFQVGETYSATSACDSNCVWTFEVVARTAKFITLREDSGETMRVGVRAHDGEEWASPFGSFTGPDHWGHADHWQVAWTADEGERGDCRQGATFEEAASALDTLPNNEFRAAVRAALAEASRAKS